jgi:hypothetical protein
MAEKLLAKHSSKLVGKNYTARFITRLSKLKMAFN